MKHYYAANNRYSTETSLGFENTWFIRVFDTRRERDQYVANASELAARAITRREIPKYLYGAPPRPFSGEHYAITGDMEVHDSYQPLRLYVEVADANHPFYVRRLNR